MSKSIYDEKVKLVEKNHIQKKNLTENICYLKKNIISHLIKHYQK